MSWDIFVQKLTEGARNVEDIPDDFEPSPIGSRAELIQRICILFPEANFSDPSWGIIEASDYSIEVNLGDDDPLTSIALHVRGGDNAPFAVASMLAGLGLGGIDPQSESGVFEIERGSREGFEKWRRFRDQIKRTSRRLI